MSEAAKGASAMMIACVIWGLSPLYYALVAHLPPLDILAHRTIWSLAFFAGILLFQRRLGAVPSAISSPVKFGRTLLAAVMISTNWGIYIYAVTVGRVAESSLGYYIFPLTSILLGLVIFRERPFALQWVAIALAALAVSILTAGLGFLPWISLALAVTFSVYGALKKGTEAGPVVSVTAEVVILAPLALFWMAVMAQGWPAGRDLAILVLSGPLTVLPLMFFSYAARRIGLVPLGLIQYLNPTLQATSAVIMGEVLSRAHAIAFGLIWTALALYSWDTAKRERARAKSSGSDATRM